MYQAFYGLREKPFNLTPDPKFLYLSEKHKEAFAHLLYGIKNRSGFVMLTGEIGTGKTTICRNLLSQLDTDTELAFIFNPFLSPIELLRKINSEFGIDTRADNLLGLTEELNIHLLNAGARGKNCVLVIDEAQNLDVKVLEQIRLLSNLETESSKLLQIILIGQPELGEKLALHELRQLNQRITARYHLKPLNAMETLQYVAYRIHVAGGRKSVSFSKGAVKQVYKLSGGTPRMINAICDRALLIGYTREEHIITAAIVRRAAREIKGERVSVRRPRGRNWLTRWMPSPAMMLAAILLIVIVEIFAGPIDRMARELGLFNRLLSADVPAPAAKPTPPAISEAAPRDRAPAETVAAAPAAADPAPVAEGQPEAESLLAKRVIDRLASVSAARSDAAAQEAAGKSLDELAGQAPEATRDAGVAAILKAWGADSPAAVAGGDSAEGLTQFFIGRGLACESLRPGTVQLVAMNLPALVRVKIKEQPRWVALVAADEDKITLALDGDRRVFLGRQAFRDLYQNEAVIPWRDSAPDAPLLLPGQKGKPVVALKQQLRALGLIGGKNTQDMYDPETVSAITALQAETGLKMDGKAGRQVRMVLAAWSGANNGPSLRPRAGAAPMPPAEESAAPAPPAAPQEAKQPSSASAPAPDAAPAVEPAAAPAPPVPAAEAAPAGAPATAAQPDSPKTETGAPAPAQAQDPKEQAASLVSAGEYRADVGSPVQVRELPPPMAMEPLPPAEAPKTGEATEPLAGSSPLVPHSGAPA